ncbi:hypothetical protein D3C85_1801980 [compost metagenome]
MDAEEWHAKRLVVAGSREGDNMRLRILSRTSPMEGALPVEPTLEDGYVTVLKEQLL